jgi:hypothetical protein
LTLLPFEALHVARGRAIIATIASIASAASIASIAEKKKYQLTDEV